MIRGWHHHTATRQILERESRAEFFHRGLFSRTVERENFCTHVGIDMLRNLFRDVARHSK